VSWASHLALTDESADTFAYAQRSAIGGSVDSSPAAAFRFAIPPASGAPGEAWTMSGSDGQDVLQAAADDETSSGAAIGLDLATRPLKPAGLHNTKGWIDFGPGGGSYYYSRTHWTRAVPSRSMAKA